MNDSYERRVAKAEAIAAHWASRVDAVSFTELRRQILDLLYAELDTQPAIPDASYLLPITNSDSLTLQISTAPQPATDAAQGVPWDALAQVMEFVGGYVGESLTTNEVELATYAVDAWLSAQRPAQA